jgi:hypothetical protein
MRNAASSHLLQKDPSASQRVVQLVAVLAETQWACQKLVDKLIRQDGSMESRSFLRSRAAGSCRCSRVHVGSPNAFCGEVVLPGLSSRRLCLRAQGERCLISRV